MHIGIEEEIFLVILIFDTFNFVNQFSDLSIDIWKTVLLSLFHIVKEPFNGEKMVLLV